MSQAYSNQDGRFRLTSVDAQGDDATDMPRRYTIGVLRGVCAADLRRAVFRLRSTEGLIKLEPGHTIHGRVVDDKVNQAGARFTLLSATAHWARQFAGNLTANDRGKFSFEDLPGDAHFSVITPIGQYLKIVQLARYS